MKDNLKKKLYNNENFNLIYLIIFHELLMSTELFFLYDSHCPWSYQATKLVKEIHQTYPKITIHLLHCAHFDGVQDISASNLKAVQEISGHIFNDNYMANLEKPKDSTLALNLLSWAQNRAPKQAFELLQGVQKAHFEQGLEINSQAQIADIIDALKLSPPAKVFTLDKYTKDAEANLQEVNELQDFIGTEAIPALLLAIDEQLIMLNHNLYFSEPEKIVDAVEIELNKHQ